MNGYNFFDACIFIVAFLMATVMIGVFFGTLIVGAEYPFSFEHLMGVTVLIALFTISRRLARINITLKQKR